jgi:hypothetical protein
VRCVLGLQRRDIQGTTAHRSMCLSAPHLSHCLGDVPADAEAVLHGHAREQTAVLRHMRAAERDEAVGRRGDEVDVFHLHVAAHRADQSGNHAHQMVLPATLGPITATASPAISRPWRPAPAERHRTTTTYSPLAALKKRLPVTRTGKPDIQFVDRRRNGGFVDFDPSKKCSLLKTYAFD